MARIFDVVEYASEMADELVHRFPEVGVADLRLGSQVIVRESQRAVFFRDGHALDVLGPGRHTISTANIPFLIDLIGKADSSHQLQARERTALGLIAQEESVTAVQLAKALALRNADELVAMHGELLTRVRARIDASDREIAAVLDEQQKVEFEKVRTKRPALPGER